ncbi:MAG: tetratricopeptide repeat protein [Chitinophagaceae bacterium]
MKLNFFKKLFTKSTDDNIVTPSLDSKQNMPFGKEGSMNFIESGKSKANKKNYSEAIADFTSAIELDPNNTIAYLERGKAKRELNDNNGADTDWATGQRILDALDNGLKSIEAGNAAYNEDDYANAVEHYNKAIPHTPTITSTYYYRGCAKQYLDNYKGALEDFDKSIEIDASNKELSYFQRSKIKSHKLRDIKGALQDLNRAIELNPNDADYYYSRAILVDDYDAVQDLNKAIELAPKKGDNYIARSLRRGGMEDFEGSISDATKYIELNPKDGIMTISEAYSVRAGMRLFQNNIEAALVDHNKAVEADPSNEKALVDRGLVKAILKDLDGAILDFNKAIELHPEYADAYYHRGTAKQDNGMKEEGEIDLIRASELGFEE